MVNQSGLYPGGPNCNHMHLYERGRVLKLGRRKGRDHRGSQSEVATSQGVPTVTKKLKGAKEEILP